MKYPKKSPTKQQIFEELVGCITTPLEEKIKPETVKLWKQNQYKKRNIYLCNHSQIHK